MLSLPSKEGGAKNQDFSRRKVLVCYGLRSLSLYLFRGMRYDSALSLCHSLTVAQASLYPTRQKKVGSGLDPTVVYFWNASSDGTVKTVPYGA